MSDQEWAAEMDRLFNRMKLLNQQLDDHRSECTPCLIRKPCKVSKKLAAEFQALYERHSELGQR